VSLLVRGGEEMIVMERLIADAWLERLGLKFSKSSESYKNLLRGELSWALANRERRTSNGNVAFFG
jgi:hypothetical protein